MIASILALTLGVANAGELSLGTNLVWQGQHVETALGQPDAAKWKPTDWRNVANDPKTMPGGTWKRTSFFASADWKDAFVRFEQMPLQRTDLIVLVNGEKAGEVLRPGGDLDLSRFIRPGATNELALYYTVSGEGTAHGPWKIGVWREHYLAAGPMAPARLVVSHGPQITDVFANTSWREKRLRLEVEVAFGDEVEKRGGGGDEVEKRGGGGQWRIDVSVADADGKVVKRVSSEVSRLTSLPCDNPLSKRYALDIPWSDPITWELNRGYLYTAKVSLGQRSEVALYQLSFGFREIWREGKDLYLNGHKVRLRTTYAYDANPYGAGFLRDIGYNVFTYNHNVDPYPKLPSEEMMAFYDREGLGVFCACGNIGNIAGDHINKDKAAAEQLRKFLGVFHRRMRNHPSLLACYVTQMIICNINFMPNAIGQSIGASDRDDVINTARTINRTWNPNILYYSHADGPNGDFSSGNIYLNWTPLQEREEWFSQWKTNGVIPWHGAEVGQPYMGCWYDRNHIYVGNEHLAEYFGDAVYGAEREAELVQNRDAGATMRNQHGSEIGHAIVQQHPYYRELERLVVGRSNSRWRADGVGGGQLWFNRQGYGSERCGMYGRNDLTLTKPTNGKKPAWASPAYDAYRLGNLDFCGYIGGAPEHTDKTHAYYAGETIAKQAVFVWDGGRTSIFRCRATFNGETKEVETEIVSGETVMKPVSFKAPNVTKKTAYKLTMTFTEGDKTWFTDTFDIEAYPGRVGAPRRPLRTFGKIALFDPKGLSAGVLKGLGIAYDLVNDPEDFRTRAKKNQYAGLVIGKFAAPDFPLSDLQDLFDKGLNVLMLPQEAETWQSFGLRPMDTGSRQLFLRDRTNPVFADITDDMLAYWRGAPKYGKRDYGPLMTHTEQRGPRWTRNHMVAALTLEIPAAVGYRSVIDGAFDMNYAGVLSFSAGAGTITYCTLDFETRVGTDPAATEVARAVFANALGPHRMGTDPIGRVGTDPILNGVLYANDAGSARKLGFNVSEPQPVFRVTPPTGPAFRGIGPSLWRWTDRLEVRKLSNPPKGFSIAADGLVAEGDRDGKHVVFVMVPQGEMTNRYHNAAAAKASVTAYQQHIKTVSEKILVALGMLPKNTPNQHQREVLAKGRPAINAWYDLSARPIVEGCSLRQGQAKNFIRVMGGSRLWNSGCGQVLWDENYQREIENGNNLFLVNPNDEVCAALGFKAAWRCVKGIAAAKVGAVELPACDLSGLDGATVRVLTSVPAGFELSSDGFYAHGKLANADVYVAMFDAKGIETQGQYYPHAARSAAYAEEHIARLYARIKTNLGVKPDRLATRRALYQSGASTLRPLPTAYVLGPFSTGKDDDDTVRKVWCEEGEKMAIVGDFNPNLDFRLPQGGVCNWRTTLASDAYGCFDFSSLGGAFGKASFPCTYAIVHVERQSAGEALLKFGVDWRARIWLNGEEVFTTYRGAHYPKFEVKLNLKKGDNVLAFKIGAGRTSNKFWALLEVERKGTGRGRSIATDSGEFDGVRLYPDLVVPAFDPYQFSFW